MRTAAKLVSISHTFQSGLLRRLAPTNVAGAHPGIRHVVRPLDEELTAAVRGVPHVQDLLRLQLVIQRICTITQEAIESQVARSTWPHGLAKR